jgi:cell surface protein SprA
VSKSGSDDWWIRNLVDATSLNFSYFDRSARSPQRQINDEWSWSGGFQYQLDFGQARTVQPLGFLPEAPVLSSLGGVAFNYVPTSLSFSGSAERSVSTTRSRPSSRSDDARPARIASPFRENQNFTHSRNFSLQYDPFGFLGLNFDTNTQQTLNGISSRTQRNLIFADSSALGRRTLTDVDTSAVFRNPQRFGLPSDVSGDSLRSTLGETLFVEDRLRLASEQDLFQDLFFGSASPRTNRYRQRLSATLRLGLLDRKALNWLSVQDISYQSGFNWQNGARGSFTGASVQNSVTLRTGVSLHPNKVWERFGFYERMKEAQRASEQEGDDRSSGPTAPSDTTGTDTGSQDEGPGWDDLPLPDPVGILRQVALTFLDIRDLTVNYNGEQSAQSSNVGTLRRGPDGAVTGVSTDYSILDAVRGEGPPLGYRLGLSRSIAPDDRVFGEGQVVDNLTNRHRFEARTALTPSSSFNIDLNWNVSWTDRPEIDIQRASTAPQFPGAGNATGETDIRRLRTESGNASASVWAFGSYQSFFEKQLAAFRDNLNASPTAHPDARDVALTKASVAADFRDAYLLGAGTSVGGNGFAPFPMPGWTVRYSGLSDWPFLKRITQSISLNHGYNAEYETGFNSIATAGDSTSLTAAGQQFNYVEAPFEPQSVQIQERFQPLIGVDVTWPFGLQTSVEWNRRTTTALRGTNVVERKTGEVSGRISYSKRGMTIPFFAQIDNRVQVSMTLTRTVNDEREYLLSEALQQAQANPNSFSPSQALKGDNVSPLSQTSLLKVVPEISYSVSNRVTAQFQLEYEKFNGDNRRPSYTNVNGSFNLSVSISEN